MLLLGTVAAQAAVALGATGMDRLHQDPVDLLVELVDLGHHGPALSTLRGVEHVFV